MAISWEWLAGFTDGDGCISIIRNMPPNNACVVRVRWSQKASEFQVLEIVSDFLHEHGITMQVKPLTVATQGHVYPQAELTIARQKDVYKLLWNLLPHLILKSDKAVEGLILLDEIEELHRKHGKFIRKSNTGGWHKGGPREKDRVK